VTTNCPSKQKKRDIQQCRVLVCVGRSQVVVCLLDCVLAVFPPSADLDAVFPTPAAFGDPILCEQPSHRHTHARRCTRAANAA